jgi:hypothetical protein
VTVVNGGFSDGWTLVTTPVKEKATGAAVAGAIIRTPESKPNKTKLSPADGFNRLILFMVLFHGY